VTDTATHMSASQIDAFLAEPRHAIVATVRTDGAPQQSPVWILHEQGRIYFSIFVDSAKYRQLERDPRIEICVDAGHPDARAVMIRGTAELVLEQGDRVEDISWRIVRRYHDSDDAARRWIEQTQQEGPAALVVVTPDRIVGRDYN